MIDVVISDDGSLGSARRRQRIEHIYANPPIDRA